MEKEKKYKIFCPRNRNQKTISQTYEKTAENSQTAT
jgi:hypothetical protein